MYFSWETETTIRESSVSENEVQPAGFVQLELFVGQVSHQTQNADILYPLGN